MSEHITVELHADGGCRTSYGSLDEILEILSHYQRRSIIRHLRDAPGRRHTIDEVVAHLQAVEREMHGETPDEDHLLSLLVHVHGPKLDDAGLVDYDVPSREIRYHPNETYEQLLERIEATAEQFEPD